jgi:hypothetical protein
MSGPLPAPGYIRNTSRTVSDAQAEWELDIAVAKETLGGTSEGATLSITSNTITPVDNYCVYPVDASGGGTINTINVSNMRDGQLLFLHCVTSSDPITIANMASGSGVQIATFSGINIVLTNPAQFVALKYNESANVFQEMFPQPNWGAPGPIGSSTASTGTFTSISVTGNVAAGTIFGNFGNSSAAPSFTSPGSTDQLLGVAHTGGGLEYKSIVAGSNISVTYAAGTITIAATGGGGLGTVTNFSAGNAAPFFTTSVATSTTTPALTFNVTAQNANTVCAGPSSGSAASPTFRALVGTDLPATVVNSAGNLSPLFTSSISSQALSFSLSNVNAGTLFGNFSGSAGAPSYNAPGSADQVLGAAHSGGGLEYKSIAAGTGLTVTPATGFITLSLSTPVSIANGGTGVTSLTGNGVVVMNSGGTAQSTVAPGANGNVLTSNGTNWTSSPASGGGSSTPDYFSYTYYGGL